MRSALPVVGCLLQLVVVVPHATADDGRAARVSLSVGGTSVQPGRDLARFANRSVGWGARLDVGERTFGAAVEVDRIVLSRRQLVPEQMDLRVSGAWAGATVRAPLAGPLELGGELMVGRIELRMNAPRVRREYEAAARRVGLRLSVRPTDSLQLDLRASRTWALVPIHRRQHWAIELTGVSIWMQVPLR